ncbi:LutB/LldF family L-lactate oxidation iron-sulfur protein [Caldimonas brevitalea]|uniref:(Fe-S)-binding protein n=1 Tax=Caldimonas brevitalea TaxID=413882 RepID=A0A0G3BCW4_9BURK|nr:LutB/LldF family L-lactate oxidation iron-sulfur protein [Caldimonas brevitalea]AKJ27177.1 (Fe-S)-binding protein [Caldimonas brevitalea]
MQPASQHFKQRARIALKDISLQSALGKLGEEGFVAKRAQVVAATPDFEALREEGRRIKDEVLQHLDVYLERYQQAVEHSGGVVHWARDAAEAREIVLRICRRVGAKSVVRGKSMVGEEIGLPGALEAAGMEVVETDLGEYIVQLADEPPSHIIAPAIHKTRAEVSELFRAAHEKLGLHGPREEVADLVDEARQVLRGKFFAADVGITGANFLVAETGSGLIVTNEGNGDLSATLPRVHIVTAGIERVVPTLDDASTLLRLLARSATGQACETYTSLHTGPRWPGETDGPEEYHVVLVDNGRSRMLAGEFREMLRCIRCGACMNHCPVYGAVGGHAYGWVYPGPMGAVLTPLFVGLDQARDLPNACTLNGRCREVCPVKIPLNDLLSKLRTQQFEQGVAPWTIRWGVKAWARLARHPRLYHLLTRVAAWGLRRLGRGRGRLRSLPLAGGWTGVRDLPVPQGETFMQAWKQQEGRG